MVTFYHNSIDQGDQTFDSISTSIHVQCIIKIPFEVDIQHLQNLRVSTGPLVLPAEDDFELDGNAFRYHKSSLFDLKCSFKNIH